MTIAAPMDEWHSPPEALLLPNGETHVWRFGLNPPPGEFARHRLLLDEDETARAERFHFERHRRRFIAAHGAMRVILGRYLSAPPASLRFNSNRYGKPTLAQPHDSRLEFSLAHSHEMGLLAVAKAIVGVDLEWMRDNLEFESVSQRFFASGECARINELPDELRKRAFFHVWARKEAYIKALGVGLSKPLDSFEVSVGVDDQEFHLREDERALEWTLRTLPVGEGYAAALAVASPGVCVRMWDFDRK